MGCGSRRVRILGGGGSALADVGRDDPGFSGGRLHADGRGNSSLSDTGPCVPSTGFECAKFRADYPVDRDDFSALLFIAARKVPLPIRVLTGSTAGAAIGFGIGTFLIAPLVPGSLVKLLFSCVWMSFGMLTLSKNREICGLTGKGPGDTPSAELIGLAAGLIGGTMASMIGVGVEMAVYTVMVLVFRADLKIAIPTAVSAAALASIEGAALHVYLGDIDGQALFNWLAAAPIVIFGAPAGAYLVSVLPRMKVLYFVSSLCVLQFIWTLQQTAHSSTEWWFVAMAMAVAVVVLSALYRTGKYSATPALP